MKRMMAMFVLLAFACTTTTVTVPVPPPSAGTIQSVVVLHDGSPLPGATVTISGPTGIQTAITDVNGRVLFGGVAIGEYTIKAELAGFGTTMRRAYVTGEGASVGLALSAASVSESITVTAEAPMSASGPAWTRSSPPPRSSQPRVRVVETTASAVPPPPAPPPPQAMGQGVQFDAGWLNDAQYAQFEDHAFTQTAKERVTTFAVDVDRASYANVRHFLTAGLVPPRDAVRIEEMINYFTYNLPQPRGNEPFSITTEVTGCPWNTQNRLLRIALQGRNLDQWKLAPHNIVFLLDVSGSMEPPARLPLLKSAFRVLVDQLRAEDRVAIVVYAGATGLVLPSTSGADKGTILAALDRLRANGTTAGAAGIELAYKVAQENFIRSGNNRVILATDGDFNIGISNNAELQKLIEEKRKSGIFLSTVGVGDTNYHDARMEMLADKGNGNYNYLDTLKEAEKVFKQELTGTLVAIAKDVKVQLDFDPSLVASYRQIGYENRALANKDFDDDAKDAGELGAGHSVTALYEIVPAANARGTIATIKLRYKAPDGDTSSLITANAVDEGKSVYEASPDMQFAAAVAQLGMLLRDSPHKGTANYADVEQLARLARGADLDGLREEFLRLIDSANMVTGKRVAAK